MVTDLAPIIHSNVISRSVPSCAYAVVFPEGIIASGAVGQADLATSRPATVGTAYPLFSATKLYTATAIMQLVEGGKISLEDPFTKVLPEYQSKGLDEINLKHLLSHTSGLPDTISALLSVRPAGTPVPVTAEVLRRYNLKPVRKPGLKVEYRNVNFIILGEVIERVSGQPYVDYITEHILKPLGMSVAYSYTESMQNDMATGYLRRGDPTLLGVRLMMPGMRWVIGKPVGRLVAMRPYELDSAPVGGLVGTVEQFAPFLVAHLNNGEGILRKESALRMQEIVAKGQAGYDAKVGMGLGWKIGEFNGSLFFNHEGSGAGFTTETRIYPDKGFGMCLMTNGYGVPVNRALFKACEAILAVCESRSK
jgi:CubicO group peptidase (beta-lactamase class C family)